MGGMPTATTLDDRAVAPRAAGRAKTLSRGRWIDHWEPEDDAFWERTGRRIARKNLAFSIFAEHIGFAIWVLWTIIVINLANIGIALSVPEQFWLTAVPNLVGSTLRIPYTFAVPRFGGRLWTTVSATLLLIPVLLVATVVPSGWLASQSTDTQFWLLLGCAATAGVGGGNFSSSMANISFFYPEGRKGLALGLNAAGGNLGVALTQLIVRLPLIVLAALAAALYMDSLTPARSDARAYKMAVRQGHTWIMSVLYIGTFGSFIGYSFALPLVIKNTFPEFLAGHPFIATYLAGLAFVGALVGSVSRPFGGWLSDKLGGARVTLGVFLGMAVFTATAIAGVHNRSFGLFFASFIAIFLLAGMGNGSTYRMIPCIFGALGREYAAREGIEEKEATLLFKRQAAAVIGIAGAIGAFGGFLIQVMLRQASLGVSALIKAADTPAQKAAIASDHADWSISALWV